MAQHNLLHQKSMSTTTDSALNLCGANYVTGTMPSNIALNQVPTTNADFISSGKRGSAVLMLFCSPLRNVSDEFCHIVFIRRSTSVKTHKGQISFPGGRCETSDGSPEETAIRETVEETGVQASDIIILGQLPVIHALDESLIVPVVGILNTGTPKFFPDAAEVDFVFTAPWTELQQQKSSIFTFNMFGNKRQSHLFSAAGHKIWGLTASIIHNACIER